jgi:CheY-like chemotaxis protein
MNCIQRVLAPKRFQIGNSPTGRALHAVRGDMSKYRDETRYEESCSLEQHTRQLTVLLIDDLETVVEVFAAALTASGYRVITALSGRDGLKLFRENPVDVTLCDLGMPHMDGWEVAKAIRETCRERGLPKPPFLLVTAWASQLNGDREIAGSGVDAVVGKPVTFSELSQAIERALKEPNE